MDSTFEVTTSDNVVLLFKLKWAQRSPVLRANMRENREMRFYNVHSNQLSALKEYFEWRDRNVDKDYIRLYNAFLIKNRKTRNLEEAAYALGMKPSNHL
ncbi:hypothetical protein L596_016998 [Steinernema carpocapsae]|uniref:Uncharacterized protein n=1 Tax=Steinernema carpocapsae TaxID=34508 RepID=A0A4U5N125_STECR|nr:hypothetical protein L596_016998 [Steinernema carpocapsae]